MIWASAVSRPTRVASKVKAPVVLIVPPVTPSPSCFRAGIGSPVTGLTTSKVRRPPPDTFSPSMIMWREGYWVIDYSVVPDLIRDRWQWNLDQAARGPGSSPG